jgi:nucleotide-binding universal stress UspA family protein
MTIQRVLFATDFSPSAKAAARLAVEIATRFDAELHIVHVYGMPGLALPDGTFYAAPDYAAKVAQSAQEALDAEVRSHTGLRIQVKGHLKMEEPYRGILEAAKETGASLIVMGTHGRRGLPRWLMGSVAERVVRSATVPVLTVHAPEPTPA